jgi:hypothetical protein
VQIGNLQQAEMTSDTRQKLLASVSLDEKIKELEQEEKSFDAEDAKLKSTL